LSSENETLLHTSEEIDKKLAIWILKGIRSNDGLIRYVWDLPAVTVGRLQNLLSRSMCHYRRGFNWGYWPLTCRHYK
jgi:hypothetical protein